MVKSRIPDSKFGALTAAEAANFSTMLGKASVQVVPLDILKPNPRNSKRHPDSQISLLAENIRKFGQIHPIVVDEHSMVLAGHARRLAMQRLGIKEALIRRVEHLTDPQKRAFAIADNRLSQLGDWDIEILKDELSALTDPTADIDFDPEIIGFDTVELDKMLDPSGVLEKPDPADEITSPNTDEPPVSRIGDVWLCGPHKLVCGNALNPETYLALLGDTPADSVFTDPPYNVRNTGHVTKRPGVREFAMARGEMSSYEFTDFLRTILDRLADNVRPGAVIYTCIDWRHYLELITAAQRVFGHPKNLVVWTKTNGGLGTFYRSQHELIPVFVAKGGSPTNNFKLGERGRYRTNVWRYPGVNAFGKARDANLAMHPTVKPVALVADALKDCSKRGDVVLDAFGGSGTTMIAAQKTGRVARLIEIDPIYCDVIVERWQTFTGKVAHLPTHETFAEVASHRRCPSVETEAKK